MSPARCPQAPARELALPVFSGVHVSCLTSTRLGPPKTQFLPLLRLRSSSFAAAHHLRTSAP